MKKKKKKNSSIYVKSKVPRTVYHEPMIYSSVYKYGRYGGVCRCVNIVYGLEFGAQENKRCHLSSVLCFEEMREIQKNMKKKVNNKNTIQPKLTNLAQRWYSVHIYAQLSKQRTHDSTNFFNYYSVFFCPLLVSSIIRFFFSSISTFWCSRVILGICEF